MERFLAVYDTHYGFEKRGSRLSPLHDQRAIDVMLAFASDFKPHHLILGGDILDCGAVSHHNAGKPRKIEGLRLLKDSELAKQAMLDPLQRTVTRLKQGGNRRISIAGNHEDWVEDLIDKEPGLDGIVNPATLLGLEAWENIPQGRGATLGPNLYFIHGDQIRGGEHAAKAAVLWCNRNVRLGHYHTHQTYTMTSAIDNELPKTGIVVPCLCTKDPKYNEGKPNKWNQGFLYGYLLPDGTFHDYVVTIIEGQAVVEGKIYRG